MKLIDISVKRPIGVVMVMIALVLIGVISLQNLAIDLYPELDLPVAVVMTEYEGAAPEEVEKLVTKPLEGSLGTIEGIKSIESKSISGSSIIIIWFNWGANIDNKVNDIRDKLEFGTRMLPKETSKPMVLTLDPTAMPIYRISVSGNISDEELTNYTEKVIEPRLERTPGVANVSLLGSKHKEIKVEADPIALNAYGITTNNIVQALATENISASAGNLQKGDQQLQLRINSEFKSIEDIENILISLPRGGTVKLKDIAHVYLDYKDDQEITKANGNPSLTLDISKKSDSNTIMVANDINKTVKEIEEQLPDGIEINTIYDLSIFIKQSINNIVNNLIVGGLLSITILFLFLRSIRSTLIIGTAMPVAVITTFSLMYFTGETLNLITLGGLALGIGMMVDSGIVILENIFRYREEGYDRVDAARLGSKEVASAVIASSLTTVAVFLPIVFVEGLAAEIFKPLAVTVSFALLVSLFAALTIVPMLSARLLHTKKVDVKEVDIKEVDAKKRAKSRFNRVMAPLLDRFDDLINKTREFYLRSLKWALNKRKTVVIGTLILILASLALVPFIGTEFLPEMDQGEISIDVTMPEGTLLAETSKTIDLIEAELKSIKEIETIFTTAGGGGSFSMGQNNSNIGNIYLRLQPMSERSRSTSDVMEEIRGLTADIPGADIKVSQMESGGFSSGEPISIQISGDNLEVLDEIAEEIKLEVEQVDGTRNVVNSANKGIPEMQIVIDREKAAYYGLSSSQIIQAVSNGINGQIATRYRSDGKEIDIRVTLPEQYKNDLSEVGDILIQTPYGSAVPLKEVADLVQVQGPAEIDRDNQQRAVQVTSDIVDRDLGSIIEDIEARLENITIPDGYRVEISGQYEDMKESFADLKFALIAAIILVYLVMAIQFEAITYPLVVMFSLPATTIGILVGLAITGRTLNIASFTGVIMLTGIVVNNAIVLVDYINILRRRGMERSAAILKAGPHRLRPILMTTLTTVLGLIPLTLGIGEGAEMQAGLATVVVFGLSFSTIVTLLLVPVMYTYIDDFEQWIKNRR